MMEGEIMYYWLNIETKEVMETATRDIPADGWIEMSKKAYDFKTQGREQKKMVSTLEEQSALYIDLVDKRATCNHHFIAYPPHDRFYCEYCGLPASKA